MTPATRGDPTPNENLTRPITLVWIDSREAVIVGLMDGGVQVERVESEVPAHHRATGHVRHDPNICHGGGRPQTAGEPHRLEHLRRFVQQIADRLPPTDNLLILGPGTVHERLARHVAANDVRHRSHREIVCEPSRPVTNRQLVARLRAHSGAGARRHTVGAHRWTDEPANLASGKAVHRANRVISNKPEQDWDRDLVD